PAANSAVSIRKCRVRAGPLWWPNANPSGLHDREDMPPPSVASHLQRALARPDRLRPWLRRSLRGRAGKSPTRTVIFLIPLVPFRNECDQDCRVPPAEFVRPAGRRHFGGALRLRAIFRRAIFVCPR